MSDLRGRIVSELKFKLNRQHKLSQAFNEDDPGLKAKFAILDDDFFGRGRNQLLEWF
jgi:hypothetical protein